MTADGKWKDGQKAIGERAAAGDGDDVGYWIVSLRYTGHCIVPKHAFAFSLLRGQTLIPVMYIVVPCTSLNRGTNGDGLLACMPTGYIYGIYVKRCIVCTPYAPWEAWCLAAPGFKYTNQLICHTSYSHATFLALGL